MPCPGFSARLGGLLGLLLAACSNRSTGTQARPEPAPSASASAAAKASASTPAWELRPPEGKATREEREQAALDLLSGKARAGELPAIDVDRGDTFEPRLRQLLQVEARGLSVRLGAVTTKEIDGKATLAAIEPHLRRFRRCYAQGLLLNPSLQGRVAARVVVKLSRRAGSVENAGSDLPDSAVVRCVLSALKEIEYPGPQEPEAEVTVPLMFTPAP